MNLSDTLKGLSRGNSIIVGVVVIAALYFGSDVLIPLVLAGLISFLLSPLVNKLEHWGLGRVPAVMISSACALALVGAVAYIVAGQLMDLAYQLPSYKENIRKKILSFQVPSDGPWGNITRTFTELRNEAMKGGGKDDAASSASGANPAAEEQAMPVKVVEGSGGLTDLAQRLAAPVLGPIGTAAVVIVFVIFMLLKKEDLRNRVIHLAGRERLSQTTQALGEAGDRVSRYLLMQVIVNVTYGIPIAIGLAIIGVPNAILWGVLTAILRFIPYIGPWIGAFFPMVLALAVSDSWTVPLYTLALFLVVELVSNNVVEPWLYGSSTGLSAVAILVAAIFWTWLWGTAGLLLATPLTVCMAVLGKHVPGLRFLDILLGEEPSLPAVDRYYQRLLAKDSAEAAKVLAEYEKEHGFELVLANLLAPAVMAAEGDMQENRVDREVYDFVLQTVRKHAVRSGNGNDAAPAPAPEMTGNPDILIIASEDEGDEVEAVILKELLGPKFRVKIVPWGVLANEKVALAVQSGAPVICISDTSSKGAPRARYLGRKLRTDGCQAYLVAGLWTFDEKESSAAALSDRFSTDQAVTSLLAARDALKGWAAQPSTVTVVAG